jgi:acyl-CoA synthetase (AMP-forming)/AMP-acid ligase II
MTIRRWESAKKACKSPSGRLKHRPLPYDLAFPSPHGTMTTFSLPHPVTSPPGFRAIPDLIREHALAAPTRRALVECTGDDHRTIELRHARRPAWTGWLPRCSATACRVGMPSRSVPTSSIDYAAVFLGALRAGVSSWRHWRPAARQTAFARMLADAGARLLFTDAAAAETVGEAGAGKVPHIALDGSAAGQPLESWLAAPGAQPTPVALQPAQAFNIIYSSGTTGAPKGIVQSHGMRWAHVTRGATYGYGPRHRHAAVHAAVLQHHAGGVLSHAGLRRHCAADAESSTQPPICAWPKSTVSPTPCSCRCSTSG